MATSGVGDLIDGLDNASEELSSIKFDFSGGTFSFQANTIADFNVSIGDVSISGPSIAVEQGTMVYKEGIDGKRGALLNFGYLGVDNIVAQNAVFSGSVAVTGNISAHGSTVVTAEDLEGMANSIDKAFKSLADALSLMCKAIQTTIKGIKEALETANKAINKANDAIKKANNAIRKVDEVARAAIKTITFNTNDTNGVIALMATIANADKTISSNTKIISAANSTHHHVFNMSVTSSGTIQLATNGVTGTSARIDVDASGTFALKSYVDNTFVKKSEYEAKIGAIEDRINDFATTFSVIGHTHSQYALANHSHPEYEQSSSS